MMLRRVVASVAARPLATPRRPRAVQRQLATRTRPRLHGGGPVSADSTWIDLHWQKGGETLGTTRAVVGHSLLEVAHSNHIDLEGACEGSVACSTCHVILEPEVFDTAEEASEDEDDMLDMAFGLSETSRLGCQVFVTEDMDGTTIHLPEATRNFYVDGHVPQPH